MQYNSLSVVISSHLTEEENNKFIKHVKDTSGVKNIQVLLYENMNEYSLSELYNLGLNNSLNNIVVFIHNDIKFETNNWGRIILNKFNNTDYGILGLAGSTDIGNDGVWWSDRNKMVGIVNHSDNGKKWESKYSNSYGKDIVDVCLVDGLFIAVNKNKIQKGFNELFTGFHYYDVSFCVDNYLKGTKIGVIFDIRVTHFSIGKTNKEWERSKLKFMAMYDKFLPIKMDNIELKDIIHRTFKIKNEPKLSIIIPHKNNNTLIFNLIDSIYKHTKYNNYNIIIADTGSEFCKLIDLKKYVINKPNIKVVEYNYYNYAKINNDVVKKYLDIDTDAIMFLNNDIVFLNDVISEMMNIYVKYSYNIGTLGARLYYENNTIQHSSINLTKINNKNYRVSHYGIGSYYKYIKDLNTNVFGNTAACMITPYNLFKKIGMFNEDYIECFEDVEYNVKCILNNKNNMIVGSAVAYHLESQTRNLNKDMNNNMIIDYDKLNKLLITNSNIVDKYVNKLI